MKVKPPSVLVGILIAASLLYQGCMPLKPSPPPASPSYVAPTDDAIAERSEKREHSPSKPMAPSPPDSGKGVLYPVWFGTNRKIVVSRGKYTPTAERHYRTNYGRVDVFIPQSHRIGETGNPFYKRLLRGEFTDDHLLPQEPEILSTRKFYKQIQEMVGAAVADGNESQALIFIHGFNVDFNEAAIRAAQIGYDLKVPGPTAFFSWPSVGDWKPDDYRADGEMIKRSKDALINFLVEFSQRSGAKKINLIAHSMGNRGLLEALQEIAGNAELRGKVRFNQIILAAPDITRDVFMQAAGVYSQLSTRTTLYSSNGDRPLRMAPYLGPPGSRVGYFKPYTVAPGVDTIVVPNFGVDQLGHSYFAQARPLLEDIHDLIEENKDPRRRFRVAPFQSDGLTFWKIRE